MYLVIGGSKGLCPAIAHELLINGYDVCLVSRRPFIADRNYETASFRNVIVASYELSAADREVVRALCKENLTGIVFANGSGRVARSDEYLQLDSFCSRISLQFAVNTFWPLSALRFIDNSCERCVIPTYVLSSVCVDPKLGCHPEYTAAKAALEAYVLSAHQSSLFKRLQVKILRCGNLAFKGSVWGQEATNDALPVSELVNVIIQNGSAQLGTQKSDIIVELSR